MILNRPVEPLLQLIQSGLGLFVILGWLNLTSEQLAGTMIFVGTFLAWLTGSSIDKVLTTAERLNEAKNEEIDVQRSAAEVNR